MNRWWKRLEQILYHLMSSSVTMVSDDHDDINDDEDHDDDHDDNK